MECRFMADAWAQRVCLQGKRLRQKWQRYRTATDTTFAITDALVTIKDGTGEHCFTLPPTFQASQYLDHIEEMAAWLRPQLQAGSISLKRCNFMPATEQIYLCQVELPALTPKEQRSWLHWEAARYVPFEPGTFVAALLPRRESGEKSVFLAAVLRERLDAWQKLIQLLGGQVAENHVFRTGGRLSGGRFFSGGSNRETDGASFIPGPDSVVFSDDGLSVAAGTLAEAAGATGIDGSRTEAGTIQHATGGVPTKSKDGA